MSEILAEFFIAGEFMALNEYTNKSRAHWSKGAAVKKSETGWVEMALYRQRPIVEYPVRIEFYWNAKDSRHDPDNISFSKKFILDGMVNARILENDGWDQIASFGDYFKVNAKDPGVTIIILKAE